MQPNSILGPRRGQHNVAQLDTWYRVDASTGLNSIPSIEFGYNQASMQPNLILGVELVHMVSQTRDLVMSLSPYGPQLNTKYRVAFHLGLFAQQLDTKYRVGIITAMNSILGIEFGFICVGTQYQVSNQASCWLIKDQGTSGEGRVSVMIWQDSNP